MKAQQILFFVGCLVVIAVAKDYEGCYGEFESCHDKGKDMCEGSQTCKPPYSHENSGSGEKQTSGFATVAPGYTPASGECVCVSESGLSDVSTVSSATVTPYTNGEFCPCQLSDIFYSLKKYFEGTLYEEMYTDFLVNFQIEILCDQSLSIKEKYLRCMDKFSHMCADEDFFRLVEYVEISGFGFVYDLVTVCTEYQEESGCVYNALEISQGKSELFEAFINCSCLSAQQYSYLEVMLAEIMTECSQCSEFDLEFAYAKAFKIMFTKYPSWRQDFFSVEISAGYSFAQLYQSFEVYFSILTSEYIVGGDSSSCPLLKALYAISCNNSIDINTRTQIYQMYQYFEDEFSSNSKCEDRLTFIMNVTYSFTSLQPWLKSFLYTIEIDYECYGYSFKKSYYELLFSIFFSYKYDMCPPVASTTPTESTTTVASTAAASTTAGYSLSCGEGQSVCNNNAAYGGQCPLIYSLWREYNGNTWPTSYKQSLGAIIGQCQKMLNGTDSNWQTRANNCYNYLAANPANSAAKMSYIFSTVIIMPSGERWGRVGDFGSCTNTGYCCQTCF